MTTATPPIKKKENTMLKAMGDLVILSLLLAAAGFGGYFYGTHQQLAPIKKVAPGTPKATGSTELNPPKSSLAAVSSSSETASPELRGKKKYWITSSGLDYIGSSITAKVNDTPVDNFFGPGKSVDITHLVKHGKNTLELDAKALGDEYNRHSGDAGAALTLQVVSGPRVTDDYKAADVVATFKRTAAQTGDANETLQFSGD
jgi:hypothetical protein